MVFLHLCRTMVCYHLASQSRTKDVYPLHERPSQRLKRPCRKSCECIAYLVSPIFASPIVSLAGGNCKQIPTILLLTAEGDLPQILLVFRKISLPATKSPPKPYRFSSISASFPSSETNPVLSWPDHPFQKTSHAAKATRRTPPQSGIRLP